MHSRYAIPHTAAAMFVAVRATSTVMVDDGDPGIQYHGNWVHNPVNDPGDFNYAGSVTFTNVSGSTATYKFAGTAIAVFGAFEVAGTFNMHSSYRIDDSPSTDFIPASTIVRAAYRQKFFQSGTLEDGEHTLVITNLGQELWFDYLLVTLPPASTSASATTSTPSQQQAPHSSTTQGALPANTPATASSAEQSATPASSAGLDVQSTHSFSNTNNVTLTSTNTNTSTTAAALLSPTTGTTSQSQTPDGSSSTGSPPSDAARAHSSKVTAGAIVGAVVGGLAVLLIAIAIVLAGCRWRRRRQATQQKNLTPYDPGLTALAFEPSEKDVLARNSYSHRGSTATSQLSQPVLVFAPAEDTRISLSGSSNQHNVLHESRTEFDEDEIRARTGMMGIAGFQPLGSPSSASPLISLSQRAKQSPVTPATDWSRDRSPLKQRRSVDGGVRIAGGPPNALVEDELRSVVSTLPPSYQVYPAI